MAENKNTLLTIGQFAQMHGINKKTLMWYDEVGIFRPAFVNKENGYRYYTYFQSQTLGTILMLRKLNVSILEIQKFMEHKSASALEALLGEKIKQLDQNIMNLKMIRKALELRKENMSDLVKLDVSKISIVERKSSYLAVVSVKNEDPFESEIERVMEETKKYSFQDLHDVSYGSMITAENLYNGNFNDYSAFYIEVPECRKKKGLHLRPKGRYLKAFCKGGWENIPERYKEIMHYAEEHSLRLLGYAYETGINEIVIDTMEDYITQIEILIGE